jgi:hypothetical protein
MNNQFIRDLIATSNFSDEIPITLTYPNLIPNLILTSNFSEEPHQPSTTQLDPQLDSNQQLQ